MPNGSDDRVDVAIHDHTLFVKVQGLAKQDNCLGIPDLLQAVMSQGCQVAIFEMSRCTGMDSTFMGVLAHSAEALNREGRKGVILVNTGEHCLRQLRKIGLLPSLVIKTQPVPIPDLEFKAVDDIHLPESERDRLIMIKQMHEELTKLNEDNEVQFGQVIRAIEEELGPGGG